MDLPHVSCCSFQVVAQAFSMRPTRAQLAFSMRPTRIFYASNFETTPLAFSMRPNGASLPNPDQPRTSSVSHVFRHLTCALYGARTDEPLFQKLALTHSGLSLRIHLPSFQMFHKDFYEKSTIKFEGCADRFLMFHLDFGQESNIKSGGCASSLPGFQQDLLFNFSHQS